MKNCLVIIRNKKLNINYRRLDKLLKVFSAGCIYFDKIAFVGFDSSKGISEQLMECRNQCENCFVLCEDRQREVIYDYLQKIYNSSFDGRFYLNCGQATVCLCPAGEDEGAFAEKCVRLMNEKYGVSYDKFYVKTVCAPAELINDALEKAHREGGDTAFSVYDEYGDQTIVISYSSTTPKMTADAVQRIIVSELSPYVYAVENTTLEERLFDLLKLRRMKISVAESFTGGGIASRLVSVSGISEVYFEGLNTYANLSKQQRLGVEELTLKQSGAVSEQTACEMASGLLATGNCDIAIATTGIAGPKSDNTSKPVGLNYIAVAVRDDIKVYKFNLRGDRKTITQTAINNALFLAYKMLK